MKYSNCSGAVRWSGGLTVLSPGQSIADDHPLALERPDLFTAESPEPDIKMPAKPGRGAPVVERATRAPGEQRVTPPRAASKPSSGRKPSGSKPRGSKTESDAAAAAEQSGDGTGQESSGE
ncbi:hypothetical protein [Streptomyces marianii]|uniref:Uncharacterized protein n=1 Tax=Streptomyces marianii TaxID=1817406 RepID=A0A5R9E6V3_9ACTN|nr:hypothetical protein [Streptomyces marianii]TLQ45760.1 hypothetical protein FEF34_24665 [Streptomyces marianii]